MTRVQNFYSQGRVLDLAIQFNDISSPGGQKRPTGWTAPVRMRFTRVTFTPFVSHKGAARPPPQIFVLLFLRPTDRVRVKYEQDRK